MKLHQLWIDSTEDTIGRAVQEARDASTRVGPELAEWVNAYVVALERLERWLRDR